MRPGDEVHTGEVLAFLESGELEESVEQAGMELAIHKAYIAQLLRSPADYELSYARADLESSRAAYQKIISGTMKGQISLAEAELKQANKLLTEAQAAYDDFGCYPSHSTCCLRNGICSICTETGRSSAQVNQQPVQNQIPW